MVRYKKQKTNQLNKRKMMFYGHMKKQSKTKQKKSKYVLMETVFGCVEVCSNYDYQIVVLWHEWESAYCIDAET